MLPIYERVECVKCKKLCALLNNMTKKMQVISLFREIRENRTLLRN